MPNSATTGPTPVKAGVGASGPVPGGQNDSVQSKRDLASWWKQFKRSDKKTQEEAPVQGIFGVPLQTSIRYANVAISLFNDDGQGYIYGYVPIVVAKCGVFLKEKATDVEGIFRLAGSEKRIKELRVLFDSPDRYGKGLDWTGYTVHDAANILRRYLNLLPEPIIPLDFYDRFRDPIRKHNAQVASSDAEKGGFDTPAAIKIYQNLITELPPLNRQLLLYILDLLAVFASKSDLNKMPTENLAAIFQPGTLSHPQHNMAVEEYRLSQDVLIFLIVNQDHFLIGMPGTAADQETVKDVQSGAGSPGRAPGTPSSPGRSKLLLGRSSSNASTTTESRWSNLRRNVSVSSRHSKQSGNGPVPLTPASGTPTTSGGVQRSNTVPSRRTASAAHSPRFSRDKTPDATPRAAESSVQNTPVATPAATFAPAAPIEITSASSSEATTPLAGAPIGSDTSSATTRDLQTPKRDTTPLLAPPGSAEAPVAQRSASGTPSTTSARGLLNILKQSPTADGESRKPNKLQKKRIPGSALSSAHSSSHDLGDEAEDATVAAAPADTTLQRNPTDATVRRPASQHSGRSHTSVTDQSDAEMVGDDMPAQAQEGGEKPKKRRWRFSRSQNKLEPGSSGNPLGTMSPRDQAMSKSTIGSQGRRESQDPAPMPAASTSETGASGEQAVFSDSERERKGPVGWIRGKIQERKEKDAEKRAKTPERKAGRETSFEVLRHNQNHDNVDVANGQPPTIAEEPATPVAPTAAPAAAPAHEKFVEDIESSTTRSSTAPTSTMSATPVIAGETKDEGVAAASTSTEPMTEGKAA